MKTYSIIILNQWLHVNMALRVRMLNTTFSSVIDSHSNGLVCSRPSVNFSLGIRLLLHGSPDLSNDDNIELFSHVQHFIKETNRFR